MKILLLPTAFACVALLGGCGLDVMYADWKVDQLCKKDGGVKVFVTDNPPAEFLMADGNVDLEALHRAKPDRSYYLVYRSEVIKFDDPAIRRFEVNLFRGRDGRLLGSSVVYIRPMQNIGVPFFHRDAHSCPAPRDLERLIAGVFFPNSVPR